MIKVLIVEDEPRAANRIKRLLKAFNTDHEVIGQTRSIEDTVFFLKNSCAPDLIFMDIHLDDGTSFSIFEQHSVTSPVIFCTAFDDYALDAFSVLSLDYLVKPISKEEFSRAMNKFNRISGKQINPESFRQLNNMDTEKLSRQFLVVKGKRIVPINASVIVRISSFHKGCLINDESGNEYFIDRSVKNVLSELCCDEWVRISRQTAIRTSDIKEIEKQAVGALVYSFSGLKPVTCSREGYRNLKLALDTNNS